jgi:hypothetical protein
MAISRLVGTGFAALILSSTAFIQTSIAQERVTYAEAWKRCTPVARQMQGIDQDTGRYLRAAACMKRFGHDI